MIPYRMRRFLRNLAVTLLILALIAGVVLLCWFLWLNRYVIYSRDGAKLDFSLSQQTPSGEPSVPSEPIPTVPIQFGEDIENEDTGPKELVRFSGYYLTLDDLVNNYVAAQLQLSQLPKGSTVMLDLKSVKSDFYYSSGVGPTTDRLDVTLVDTLIDDLQKAGHYLIARIPAFQEYDYILENQTERVPWGLPRVGGNGSLWLDAEGPCYWMNPAKEGTANRLSTIIIELRLMGFDEVVLADFRFPETDKIRFEGDKNQALTDLAASLISSCATDRFCLSFERQSADLVLPEARTRLYLKGVSAAQAGVAAGQASFADKTVHVVFVTETGDTRYDEFCALRPLAQAH